MLSGLALKTICAIVEVMRQATILKQNGGIQHGDIHLTQEIARALVQKVLSCKTIYPPNRRLELLIGAQGEERSLILSTNTIESWCRRGNIIPGTTHELRAVLDEAREAYRTNKKENNNSYYNLDTAGNYQIKGDVLERMINRLCSSESKMVKSNKNIPFSLSDLRRAAKERDNWI